MNGEYWFNSKYNPCGRDLSVLTTYVLKTVIWKVYFLYPVYYLSVSEVVSSTSCPPFLDALIPTTSCKVSSKLIVKI